MSAGDPRLRSFPAPARRVSAPSVPAGLRGGRAAPARVLVAPISFLERARQDLAALEANWRERWFYNDTAGNVYRGFRQAIQHAQTAHHDEELHLFYQNMKIALGEIGAVDGIAGIFQATLQRLGQGEAGGVLPPRARPVLVPPPVPVVLPAATPLPLPSSAPIRLVSPPVPIIVPPAVIPLPPPSSASIPISSASLAPVSATAHQPSTSDSMLRSSTPVPLPTPSLLSESSARSSSAPVSVVAHQPSASEITPRSGTPVSLPTPSLLSESSVRSSVLSRDDSDRSELDQKMKPLQERNAVLESENKQLREEKVSLEQKVTKLQSENSSLVALLEQNKQQHEAMMKELKTQHQDAIDRITQGFSAILTKAVSEKDEALKSLKEAIQVKDTAIQAKDDYIALLKSEKGPRDEPDSGGGASRATPTV